MLSSQLGIRILLLIGPTIPIPVPSILTGALARAEVQTDERGNDGFQLTFSLSKDTPLDYTTLLNPILAAMNRVVVGVMMGVMPEVLIDGVITHHQFSPGSDPGQTTLTITGRGLTALMDLKEKNRKFDNQPDWLIATRLIAEYSQYGLIPAVFPSLDVPLSLERIPRQQETDLQLLERMAQRNGYVFYIEPVTIGVNKAYWGPQVRAGRIFPALTGSMGPASNLKALNFTRDSLAPVASEGTFTIPTLRTTVPIPALPSLRLPPLALIPDLPLRTTLQRDTNNRNPISAAVAMLAAMTSSPDSLIGTGSVDGQVYGGVLRSRSLVGVRGVGFTYDGVYYIERVSHTLEPGKYEQSFTIRREGVGSLLPVLPVF